MGLTHVSTFLINPPTFNLVVFFLLLIGWWKISPDLPPIFLGSRNIYGDIIRIVMKGKIWWFVNGWNLWSFVDTWKHAPLSRIGCLPWETGWHRMWASQSWSLTRSEKKRRYDGLFHVEVGTPLLELPETLVPLEASFAAKGHSKWIGISYFGNLSQEMTYTDGRIVRTQFLKIVAKSRLSS